MDVIMGNTLQLYANESRSGAARAFGAGTAAVEAAELETSLLGFAAHELKNPLNAITLATRYLRGVDRRDGEAVVNEICGDIESSVDHMYELISRLLEHHRVQRLVGDAADETVNVEDCVERVVRRFKHQVRADGLELDIRSQVRDLTFYGRRAALEHTLDNLLANAIRFSPLGGRIDITIGLCRAVGATQLRGAVTIGDEGPGIAAADARRIFDMFTRLAPAASGAMHSHGLGLALCRQIMRQMRGDIRLEQGGGRGALFTILLPVGGRESPAGRLQPVRSRPTNVVPAPGPDSAASETR